MANFLVSGLVNLETNVKTDGFPIDYMPITYPLFGVKTAVSGVGYNISKALMTLGNGVDFYTLIYPDEPGNCIKETLHSLDISTHIEQGKLKATPTSANLYDTKGRRRIFCDLKNIQTCRLTALPAEKDWERFSAAVICNINFAKPLLKEAKRHNVPIVTDLHVFSNINDKYNNPWLKSANTVFLSDEGLPCTPKTFLRQLSAAYPNIDIIVLGQGSKGALLYKCKEHTFIKQKAVKPVKVVNTVGAGDALLSAFTHFYYGLHLSAEDALHKAQTFASIKIGFDGGAEGFKNID